MTSYNGDLVVIYFVLILKFIYYLILLIYEIVTRFSKYVITTNKKV